VAKKPADRAKAPKAPREVEIKPDKRPPAVAAAPAPLRLGRVLGQDRAVATLRSAVQSGRIHHAWIFHGPVGVGKFTTALALAAVILDPSSQPDLAGVIEPDPDSRTQQLLAAGTHPDLHIITKELAAISREASVRDSKQRNIAKDVLDEFLIEPATRTGSAAPGALASKVFIIDEAELIDPTGQNSLLKTLEEPPVGSVLILVTSREERLLPTIRSRSQRVGFGPLGDAEMEKWLKVGGTDLSALDAGARRWLLSYAGGSPGSAMLAAQTGITGWHAALAPMLAEAERGKFPLDLGGTMAKLVDEWAAAWVERPGNEHSSKDAANKAAARLMFRLLSEHFRGVLHASPAGERAELALAAIDLVAEAERQADASVQALFVMDNLAAQLVGLGERRMAGGRAG
jgi:DNA polymerase III subunit delta'